MARDAEARGASRALVVVADVTRRADVEALGAAAVDAFGGYDVWINNAGRGITRNVLDLTEDDIDQMVSINLKSALYGMQVAARHFMERGGGQIINVSSFLGRVPMAPQRSAYSAMKAALNSLGANLRADLREKHPGVHVTTVMPGMVATEFGRNTIGAAPGTPIYSGPQVQSAEDVADIIARAIETPRAEVYTNPASEGLARKYFEDVGAFEAQGIGWGPR